MVEKALEEKLRCIMKTFAEKTWGNCKCRNDSGN